VIAKWTTYLYVYVDADSHAEAMYKSIDLDRGEFIPMDQGAYGEWDIYDINEVDK
jgi:hypothetical protein